MNQSEIIGKTFLDSYGYELKVEKILGDGGQGLVCMTDNPKYVLKFILYDKVSLISKKENPQAFNYYKLQFEAITLFPLERLFHIATPVSLLTEYAGYVMQFMEDMIPVEELMKKPETYPLTGGHRHRLEILSKLASNLAYLHAIGLVYCDISHTNIFITKDMKHKNQNVWFIDADNLFIPRKDEGKKVRTERYAAPELLKNEKIICSQNTDLYSFAILAFDCLCAIHPFAGDAIENRRLNREDAWDKSSSKVANSDIDPLYSGNFAWIDDIKDTSNRTSKGFPREFFLTEELSILFNQMFSVGKDNPQSRPTAFFWEQSLARAADLTLQCLCGMSYVHKETMKACPYCGDTIILFLEIKKDNKTVYKRELVWDEKKEKIEAIQIPERIFIPFHSKYNAIPAISITAKKEKSDGVVMIERTSNSFLAENLKIKIINKEEKKELHEDIMVFEYTKNINIRFSAQFTNYKESVFDIVINGDLV
ncbi:MAG: protein kinase domain-containing protein [Treponemataceae bacterium]